MHIHHKSALNKARRDYRRAVQLMSNCYYMYQSYRSDALALVQMHPENHRGRQWRIIVLKEHLAAYEKAVTGVIEAGEVLVIVEHALRNA